MQQRIDVAQQVAKVLEGEGADREEIGRTTLELLIPTGQILPLSYHSIERLTCMFDVPRDLMVLRMQGLGMHIWSEVAHREWLKKKERMSGALSLVDTGQLSDPSCSNKPR